MCGAISELAIIYIETRADNNETAVYLEFLRLVKKRKYVFLHDNVSFDRTD